VSPLPPGPVCVDLAGPVLQAQERARLAHPAVGMVILFTRNYRDPEQLALLCEQIRAARDTPPLIVVDQEGGRVQRFRAGFTALPPLAAIGRLWDRDPLAACAAARAAGLVTAAELRCCGVDLTLAPVLDLDRGVSSVIGARALHADPRTVALLGGQFAHGLALAGMACCGKHFPGHGAVVADSHHDLPVDPRPLEEILAQDALPYARFGPGLHGVMLAHVRYPAVDERAAGFSQRWIGEVLRTQLGFVGAVLSDDLSMAGARSAGDVPQAAQAALEAGCDFLLVCNAPEAADAVLQSLVWDPADTAAQARRAGLRPWSGEGPAAIQTRLGVALAQARATLAGLPGA
jgi:beta-N-acetylhexosaminidase